MPANEATSNIRTLDPATPSIDIDDLFNNRATCNVEFRGWEFPVTYRPDAITSLTEAEARKQQEDEQSMSLFLIDLLLPMVIEWGVVNKGVVVPLEREAMQVIPVTLLRAIFDQVSEHARPKKKTSTRSNSTFGR